MDTYKNSRRSRNESTAPVLAGYEVGHLRLVTPPTRPRMIEIPCHLTTLEVCELFT